MRVALRSLIKLHYGKALRSDERNDAGQYPVYGSSGEIGKHNVALFEGPTIIIGRKGSVGALTYAPIDGWAIDTAFYTEVLNPNEVDLRYLFHALKYSNLARHTITTSIPGLNRDDIYRSAIPWFPIEQQRRIAGLLDKCTHLREKRQQAINKLDRLTLSVFLDMFGDPVANPKGWPKHDLKDLCVDPFGIKAGPFGSSLKKETYSDSGYRIYGQEQVIAGNFKVGNYYISQTKFDQMRAYEVKPGDVLMSVVGTIGRSIVVPSNIEPGIINPRLLKISPRKKVLHPYFLCTLLSCSSIQRTFTSIAHGGTMNILNAGILKKLRLILPPFSLQEKFYSHLIMISSLNDKFAASNHLADIMLESLQGRVFNGSLHGE